MEIKEIVNQSIWHNFFVENGSLSFLQSWEWGELQKKMGYDILRLGIYDNNLLTAISLVIKIKAKRGNFLFIPHGPIIKNIKYQSASWRTNIKYLKSIISQFLSFLISISKTEGFSFIRIAPILENNPENKIFFKNLNFKTAPIYMHAETVWILSLNKTEDELLRKMRKTTRYSIRKAVRDGVVIEKRTDEKAVDDFYKIYQETAKRENFVPFSKDYIRKEFEVFNKLGNAVFLFAKIKNVAGGGRGRVPDSAQRFFQPVAGREHWREGIFRQDPLYLASALVLFTHSTAFYHQGASIHTKYPATYLLQWRAIQEAKKRNCQFYNFWGIYDEQTQRMPKAWQGLTLFKTGFGGNKICYLPTQDYIISPKYYFSFFYEKWLNWRRGV